MIARWLSRDRPDRPLLVQMRDLWRVPPDYPAEREGQTPAEIVLAGEGGSDSQTRCRVSSTRIENAIITDVTIGREGHGVLTVFIGLDGGGWGVTYGGYAMDNYDKARKRRIGHAFLAQSLLDLFDVFKVDRVDRLVGLPCRVENEGYGGRARRIGHFTDDRWFSFEALADTYKNAEGVIA